MPIRPITPSIRRGTLAVSAVLSLLSVTGCAGTAESLTVVRSSGAREHSIERSLATCMEQNGFRYVPDDGSPWQRVDPELNNDRLGRGDYAAMRSYRAKYGHGAFAIYVFPQKFGNPRVKPEHVPISPNGAIRAALSPTQRRAYQEAYDRCYGPAVKQATGKDVASEWDHHRQISALVDRLVAAEIDADPRLVRLAENMADCLRAKGYAVESTLPSALAGRGFARFNAEITEIGRTDDISDEPLKSFGTDEDGNHRVYQPNLTPLQAGPYLTREIGDALDDLECGREFYPVYKTRYTDIQRRAHEEFGLAE